jgi:signal transduction histidine kinase
MHAEIFLAIMVLAVALLVAADFFRRASEGPHENTERPAYDAGRESFTPPRSSRAMPAVTAFQPARTGRPSAGPPGSAGGGGPSRPPAGRGGATATPDAPAATGSWLVRTRLSLLAAASALAAAVATASAIRAIDIVQGPSYHSGISSIRDGAAASVIFACVIAVVALAVGGWAAVILIRSVLRPLRQLRTGAVELAEVRLPDALRGGGRGPLAVRSVGVSSSDEIGQIARAFDRVQAEVLGLTSDEAGLRGKLGDMFVELSSRSQTLVERQIRLIDELEQGEQDAGRLASLFKMDHIATRMRRHSQNLLVLAGHELPGQWSQPVALVDVIRAAVSELEEYERISLTAQPGIAVSGSAVKDVVHLLAELAENATSLSSAGTPVDVSGRALASGGVLIDITDQGVGMNPEILTEANRRLDSPPAMDFAISRNMGLFVVGRLAARHGIKVRLQPAAAGGLTALVWLPDAVANGPDGDPGVLEDAGPGWGAHASPRPGLPAGTGPDDAPGLDRRPARPEAATQSMWSAPVLEDVRGRPRPDPTSAADARPGRHTWSASRPQPSFHPHPAASPSPDHAQPSAAASPQAPALPARPHPPAPFQRLVASPPPAQARSSAVGDSPPAVSADEPSAGEAGRAADAAEEGRLPIYDAVESDWFGNRRKLPSGSADAGRGWTSPADPGWGAAQAAVAPVSNGTTTAGLPVRVPRANLVPGTAGGAQPDKPPISRSASALRDRLSGFQHGTSQGRAALNRDGQDQAP